MLRMNFEFYIFNFIRKKMLKKVLSLLLFLILGFYAYAQNNSTGLAPFTDRPLIGPLTVQSPTNVNTRGFSYQTTSLTASTLFKYFVGSPSAVTVVGSVQPYFFGNGDYANPTGIWKFYVQEQVAAPYNIYEVDTATGNITLIGGISGLTSGHSPILLEWDHTTNQFYVFSFTSSVTSGQLYTMNWSTRVCTPIGPPNINSPGLIAGGFNKNGTLFAYDLTNDNVWKVNKATGISTFVGSSGYLGNYGQDAGFDRSDWKLYWAACGGIVGLRQIDTATGLSTQIGTFPYTQVLATCFTVVSCPSIIFTPLQNTTNLTGPYVINCVIYPLGSGINPFWTKIFWSRNNPIITDSVQMINTSGNNWTGSIPGNSTPATYRYYVRTADSISRFTTAPQGAPSNYYTFIATNIDTSKPVISHTPLGNCPKVSWPKLVECSVTDPFGISAVMVRWRNSRTNITKTFNMTTTGGNNWAGTFNSDTSEVQYNDSIYYRIIATDGSAQLNKDSTALYGFKIINQATICIGTGTTAISDYPFNTYWWANRTQMLWTSAEINSNAGTAGYITRIGFQISVAAAQTMNGFMIRIQHTTNTTVTGFTVSGWTNAFIGTYTVPGTGWQYINLQTPFPYNGTQNLLVDVCFYNTSYTSATTVLGTAATNNVWYHYADIVGGCGATGGSAGANRPNVCFVIITMINANNNTSIIPDKYSLSQNYPNPFNPVTRIKYDIPKQGLVTMKIYDVLGRKVTELVNEVKVPGSYIVDFDGTNLSSGVYFYKLETGTFSDVKRMMLIK